MKLNDFLNVYFSYVLLLGQSGTITISIEAVIFWKSKRMK